MRTFYVTSIFAIACLGIPSLALSAEKQTFEQTFTKYVSQFSEDCRSDKQPDNCKLAKLLSTSQKAFRGTGAEASLIMWEGELDPKKARKSREELKQLVDGGLKRDEILPWIDEAKRMTSDTKTGGLVDTYRLQIVSCLEEIKPRKGDNHDTLSERVDICDIKTARASDSVLVSIGKAPELPSSNFRKSKWGETSEQVIRTEGSPTTTSNGKLIYKTTVDGIDAFAIFKFVNNRLVEGGYFFTTPHSNKNNFIDDFDSVDKVLNSKYGNSKPETVWENSLYKTDRSHWGLAISAGQMGMTNYWRTIDTKVSHLLTGDNYEVKHLIRYESVEFAPIVRQDNEARSTRDL